MTLLVLQWINSQSVEAMQRQYIGVHMQNELEGI